MLDFIYNYGSFIQFLVTMVFYIVLSVCAIMITTVVMRHAKCMKGKAGECCGGEGHHGHAGHHGHGSMMTMTDESGAAKADSDVVVDQFVD